MQSLSSTTWHFAAKADILEAALRWTARHEVARIGEIAERLGGSAFDPAAWAEELADRLLEQVTVHGQLPRTARLRYRGHMGPTERLTTECPRCGKVFETWALGTPDLDADPALGDPGWMFAASEATCPHCGFTGCCTGLAAEREAWRTDL